LLRRQFALGGYVVLVSDAAQSTYYIDPARAVLLGKLTQRSRLERWRYHGLHSFDFPCCNCCSVRDP
jgi:hypothetical protein